MHALVIAPHADDETLGCGGTLLKHKRSGDTISWLLLTCARTAHGYSEDEQERECAQIELVRESFGFDHFVNLELPPAQLDTVPRRDLAAAIGRVVRETEAECLYLPHPGDAHSDHFVTFEAACSATKWFRYPGVRRVATYETVSETEFGISPLHPAFRPNWFVDIGESLAGKLRILGHYSGQMDAFPFPRSDENVVALAKVRGATAGFEAAEAFMILKTVW